MLITVLKYVGLYLLTGLIFWKLRRAMWARTIERLKKTYIIPDVVPQEVEDVCYEEITRMIPEFVLDNDNAMLVFRIIAWPIDLYLTDSFMMHMFDYITET